MSLQASATAVVAASSQEVLEFVLDLERYQQADHKISRVSNVVGPDADGRGSAKLWGKLRWGPAAPDVQEFTLDRWSGITFVGARRQPARLVFDFIGTFTCEPVDAGTEVTHTYDFSFKGPFRLLARPMGGWLQAEIEAEVARIVDILGAPAEVQAEA